MPATIPPPNDGDEGRPRDFGPFDQPYGLKAGTSPSRYFGSSDGENCSPT
jgi:hypothetical protein